MFKNTLLSIMLSILLMFLLFSCIVNESYSFKRTTLITKILQLAAVNTERGLTEASEKHLAAFCTMHYDYSCYYILETKPITKSYTYHSILDFSLHLCIYIFVFDVHRFVKRQP